MEQDRHVRPEAGAGYRLAAPALRARRRYYGTQSSPDFATGVAGRDWPGRDWPTRDWPTRDWAGQPAQQSHGLDEAGLIAQSMRGLAPMDWARLNWARLNEARLNWTRAYLTDYGPVLRNGAIIGAMGAVGFSVALYTSQPGLMKKVDKLVQAELALLPDPGPNPRPDAETARAAGTSAPLVADAALPHTAAPMPAGAPAPVALILAAALPAAAGAGQIAPALAAPIAAAPVAVAQVSAPGAAGFPAAIGPQDARVAAVAQLVAAPADGILNAAPQAVAAAPPPPPVPALQAQSVSANAVQAQIVQAQAVQAPAVQAETPQAEPSESSPAGAQSLPIRQAAPPDIAPRPAQAVLASSAAPAPAVMPAPAAAAPTFAPAPPTRVVEARIVRMSPAMSASPLYAAPVKLHRAAMLVAMPRIPTIEPSAGEMRAAPHPAPRAVLSPRVGTPVALHLKPYTQRPSDPSKYALPDWLTHARPARPSTLVMSEKPHYLVAATEPHQNEPQTTDHVSPKPAQPVVVAQRDDAPASPQPEADALTEAASSRQPQEEARQLPALRQPAVPRYAPARWYYGRPYYAPPQQNAGYYGGQYMPPPPPAYGYGYGYGYGQ